MAAASPSLTSVSAKVASLALIAMSAAATIPMPPARTAPGRAQRARGRAASHAPGPVAPHEPVGPVVQLDDRGETALAVAGVNRVGEVARLMAELGFRPVATPDTSPHYVWRGRARAKVAAPDPANAFAALAGLMGR